MSLIEALITVAISVLIASIALPRMDSAMQASARTSAQVTLVADLRSARAQAMRTGAAVTLTIGADGAAYDAGQGSVTLPRGVRVAGRARRITFFPDGSTDGSLLTIGDKRAVQHLRLAKATGLVTREDGGR